ncbi:MAG: sigma-70 family RNA polymerase sigma factor [Planctomycetaceae bacterium]|nr:sigma-70 family RNA polymerase sigma factor [Planctomycetaceae bacterium]
MTDAELLLRVQRGELAAWDSLYARCLPTVWRYACAWTRDVSAAEEIVSETLLALVQGLPGLDADAVHLHGWLRGIVQHKAADYGRQISKQRRLIVAASHGAGGGNESLDASFPLEAEETRYEVLAALDRLPENQRLILEWKHADGQTVREIAVRLGQTEKAVESQLYRARKDFRRFYELECVENPKRIVNHDVHAPTLEKSL